MPSKNLFILSKFLRTCFTVRSRKSEVRSLSVKNLQDLVYSLLINGGFMYLYLNIQSNIGLPTSLHQSFSGIHFTSSACRSWDNFRANTKR